MIHSAYSPHKLVHHPALLDALRRGEQPAPVAVQVILSDLCNQSCSFCAYRMEGYTSNQQFGVLRPDGSVNNNPNRLLPTAKALEILGDCVAMGVKSIEFTGGGEPTVHPQHAQIFETALDIGLDIALVTNGMVLPEKTRRVLGRAAWVRFSVDAGSSSTYAAIRRVPSSAYARVLRNIDALVQSTPRPPVIGISYVVLKENWAELLAMTTAARALGVDYLRLSAVFTPEDAEYYADIYNNVRAVAEEAAALQTPTFRVFNQFGQRLDDLVQHNPDYPFCGHMHVSTYVGADQSVYRCCALAYNERGRIGSIETQRFRELWESDAKQKDFRAFDARGCVRCPFNAKNRFINYCLDPEPLHVNYV